MGDHSSRDGGGDMLTELEDDPGKPEDHPDGGARVGGLRRSAGSIALATVFGCIAVATVGVSAQMAFGFGGHRSPTMLILLLVFMPALGGITVAAWEKPHAVRLCALLIGVALGAWFFYATIGRGVSQVWAAPADRPGDVRAVGDWVVGDLVVRARPDIVVAYRLGDGRVAWTWAPPGREVVCAMSDRTASGTGLIGYTEAHGDGPECDRVTALDLSTGRPRWTTTVHGPSTGWSPSTPGTVAATRSSVVLQDGEGWRAVNMSDGRTLWRAGAAHGCSPLRVAAGPNRVVTAATCGGAAPVLRSLSPSDGRELWHAPLPARGEPRGLALLSVDPVTVWIFESGPRGTRAVVSYDESGRARATIPQSGTSGELAIPLDEPGFSTTSFAARPAYGALVVGDLLITSATRPGDVRISNDGDNGISRSAKGRLVAFSLIDGTLRWTAKLDDHLNGIAADGDAVWALTVDTIARVDAATGERLATVAVHGTRQINTADLWRAAGRFVIVAEDGTESVITEDAPARVLR